MKNALTLGVMLFAITQISIAQEQQFKPVKGSNSLELTFNPGEIFSGYSNFYGSSSGSSGLGLPAENGIKYRRWYKDKVVLRATAFLGMSSTNNPHSQYYIDQFGNEVYVNLEDMDKSWNISLSPGIEWHFNGTKRFSPYLGGVFSISYGESEGMFQQLDNQYSGYVIETKYQNYGYSPNFPGLGFSIGGVAGFDFYIAKSIFLGVELGYSFNYLRGNTVVFERTDEEKIETPGSTIYGFSPTLMNNFRLGWVF